MRVGGVGHTLQGRSVPLIAAAEVASLPLENIRDSVSSHSLCHDIGHFGGYSAALDGNADSRDEEGCLERSERVELGACR